MIITNPPITEPTITPTKLVSDSELGSPGTTLEESGSVSELFSFSDSFSVSVSSSESDSDSSSLSGSISDSFKVTLIVLTS